MATRLRIMAWNIAEGRYPNRDSNAALPDIAAQIRALSPDLVLLNEVKNERGWPYGSGVNQVEQLASLTGMAFRHWGNTTATGLTGHKAVGVLSRYTLGAAVMHPVIFNGDETAFATIETSITVNNVTHRILSTRFAPQNTPEHEQENPAGIAQAAQLIRGWGTATPIIFGGDFNAKPESAQIQQFVATSRLRDAFVDLPDPAICDANNRIDYLFYAGSYVVRRLEQRCPWGDTPPSDHAYVYAELEWTGPTEPTECQTIRGKISQLNTRLDDLREQQSYLDPKDPLDRELIMQIQEQIEEVNAEIAKLRKRSSELGCA